VQSKEAAKGRFWFLESDLRAGTAVKMDKTGKSMLMLLRHLGRLQEVRTWGACKLCRVHNDGGCQVTLSLLLLLLAEQSLQCHGFSI
jgi:hypothetical protein